MNDDIVQDGEGFIFQLKVPKDRIAVFIGEKGVTKRKLQDHLGVQMDVDSREGEVTLISQDSFKLYIAKDIIKAIARGFNPEIAQLLLKQDYVFELIDISDYVSSKEGIQRLKGRVIGVQGKSRSTIENLTECFISVYGKTVAIIGETNHVMVARKAVESLLSGSQHAAVYKWLEKQRRTFRD